MPDQHDEIDATNREAFEEYFRIVKAAWTERLLQLLAASTGRFRAAGTPWDLEASRLYGKGSPKRRHRPSVGVVPKPLQKPHPPIFQPFASSENSIRWCAREGVTAILPPLHPKRERALFDLYAAESGRPLGDGIGYLRDLIIADSDAEARQLWNQSSRLRRRLVVRAVRFQPRPRPIRIPVKCSKRRPDDRSRARAWSERSTPCGVNSTRCAPGCRSTGSSRGCTTACCRTNG